MNEEREKWLSEFDRIRQATEGGTDGDGLTTAEIAAATGLSENSVRIKLNRAKSLGILRIGNTFREGLDGRQRPVQCYRIIHKENSGD